MIKKLFKEIKTTLRLTIKNLAIFSFAVVKRTSICSGE